MGQLDKLRGFEPEHADFIPELLAFLANLGQIHWATFIFGMICLVLLFLMHRFTPKIPAALTVMILAILVSYLADLESVGVHIVGEIGVGLVDANNQISEHMLNEAPHCGIILSCNGNTVGRLKLSLQNRNVRTSLGRMFLIEDYLEYCAERGEEPEKPFSGKFTVRITPELHRKIYVEAKMDGKTLNRWVNEVFEKSVDAPLLQP